MPFIYERTVRFQDTDAAGVAYFANILSMCHEAYEASLADAGINLNRFFCYPKIAIPITHSSIDFTRPLFCGDRVRIYLTPRETKDTDFEVSYEACVVESVGDSMEQVQEAIAARALTRHTCIDSAARMRTFIPDEVMRWLHQWGDPNQSRAARESDLLL